MATNGDGRGSFDPNEISNWFWSIIDDAEGSRKALESRLHQLERDEIIRFQDEFLDAAVELTGEPFLDHRGDYVSEDTMQDVAEWVVSQGKRFYVDVWNRHCLLNQFYHSSHGSELNEGKVGRGEFVVACGDSA